MEPIRDFTINGKSTDNQIFCCAPYDLNFLNTSDYTGNATWVYGNSVTGAGDATVNTYAAANTYTVTMSLATSDGCDYTATKTVVIQPKPFMYVPNAFSPINRSDPNDKNSFFDVILPSEGIITYSINVYDRWGKRMFTTTDPAKKWNGGMENDLGKSCPVGIYVYVIRAEFVEGSIYNRSGTVAITN